MKIENINEIPAKISKGYITEEEACRDVATFFLENKNIFKLFRRNESREEYCDRISEITEYLLFKGKKILENYDSSRGSFFNYLYTTVWNKDRILRHTANFKRITRSITKNLLESTAREVESPFTDSTFIQMQEKTEKKVFTHKNETRPVKEVLKDRRIHFQKKLRLLLLLKSCFYITDSDIIETAQATNTSISELFNYTELLNSEIDLKRDRIQRLISRRNSAFILMNNYKSQLDICDAFYEYKTMDLKKKISTQERLWNISQRKGPKICPSNKKLAELLDMNERTIGYYLEKGMKLYGENSKYIEEN